MTSLTEIFFIFLRLGLTSFGGPIAHLSYFHREFVIRRQWLSEHDYAELVALTQILPGPASSQVGIAIGLSKRGPLGSLAAWAGFTLPSAIAMTVIAIWFSRHAQLIPIGIVHGLKIVAVAVVAQALVVMAPRLCPDISRVVIAVLAACGSLLWPATFVQLAMIVASGLVGFLFLKPAGALPTSSFKVNVSRRTASVSAALLIVLFLLLPLMTLVSFPPPALQGLKVFDRFFRTGALVFGGGHVVLPLLQAEVVQTGWVSADDFVAGYGVVQAMPGPLFTISAFLGAVSRFAPAGVAGAGIALSGIFLPSFLYVFAALPFWSSLRKRESLQRAVFGVNAAVVGLLVAAFCSPVWTSAVHSWRDAGVAAVLFAALVLGRVPPIAAVIAGGVVGFIWL